MPGAITTYAVDSTGPVNVVAVQSCNRIEVRENYDSATPPTADLKQFKPAGSSEYQLIPKGVTAVFEDFLTYAPGQTVGQIQTVSGSITVAQSEFGIGRTG